MKITNIDDLKAQAIAVYGNQKKYNFDSIDEMIEKLEELNKLDSLINALEEIANGHLQENVSERIAQKALEKFRTK